MSSPVTAPPLRPPRTRMSFEQFVCWAMTAVCAGGGIYGYMKRASLPSLIAGLGFGALYGMSARLIQNGRILDVASTLMLVAMGPRAYATKATMPTALCVASGIIMSRMGYVSYNIRHHAHSH